MENSPFAALMDAGPCGLLLFDDRGAILDANTTLLGWLGRTRAETLGQNLEALLPSGGRIFYQTHLFPLLRSAGSVSEMYFALRTLDGRELPILFNAQRSAAGETASTVLVCMLINNRQQFEGALLEAWHAEQAARADADTKSHELDKLNAELAQRNAALVEADELLRQSNASKDEFIGLVAHELKNPLSALSGTFGYLTRNPATALTEDSETLIRDLHLEFTRLISVIDNLLIIARSEMTDIVDIEPVLIARLIRAVITKQQAGDSSRALELDMPAELPMVLASWSLTEQILENFITNARKYGTENSPIRVLVRPVENRVSITVANEGEELTAAEVDRFFGAFYRDARHRFQAPGVGLGLTVCQRLAEAQNATISAQPRQGGGLEISLLLPVLADI